jgi:glutamate/tyrosine decarboxylase-like PLP-dependent enzyme
MQAAAEAFQNASEVLPAVDRIKNARSNLFESLPTKGHGLAKVRSHMQEDLVPAFERHNKSPHYYGFVTGGTTPASLLADHIAVDADQTVQVNLPNDTIAVDVDDQALHMLCELFDFSPDQWPHRIFTTGATGSNILGLACGREYAIQQAAVRKGLKTEISVADHGLLSAMVQAGLRDIQILTTVPHSSLRKAASIVGLGRGSVRDVGLPEASHRFDKTALEAALSDKSIASIVVISCGEVNTGYFATDGQDMHDIRRLCDQYGAWLHVDAAFGLMARVLPSGSDHHRTILDGVAGMELADSITGDAHKLLNVVGLRFHFHFQFVIPSILFISLTPKSHTIAASSSPNISPLARMCSKTQTQHTSTSLPQSRLQHSVLSHPHSTLVSRTPAAFAHYLSTPPSPHTAEKAIEI